VTRLVAHQQRPMRAELGGDGVDEGAHVRPLAHLWTGEQPDLVIAGVARREAFDEIRVGAAEEA
jgi:hypothetical protein